MNEARISKYDPRQLFTWASVALLLLLLGVQFFAFSGGSIVSSRLPPEVRTAREKVRAVDEARQALARRGTGQRIDIPDRDYAAIDPAILATAAAAEAAAAAETDDLESYVAPAPIEVAPVVIASPAPELKGIVQTRDASGQVRLRASYPRRIVTEGESVSGYLVEKITLSSVTLTRDGKTIVQQVANNRLLRLR